MCDVSQIKSFGRKKKNTFMFFYEWGRRAAEFIINGSGRMVGGGPDQPAQVGSAYNLTQQQQNNTMQVDTTNVVSQCNDK